MLKELIHRAENGESLWLPDLRKCFEQCEGSHKLIVRLCGGEDFIRDYDLFLPPYLDKKEEEFLLRYVSSNIYNILSAYSGREVILYCDEVSRSLLSKVPKLFDTDNGLGKVRNIARRIHGEFRIAVSDRAHYFPIEGEKEIDTCDLGERLRELCIKAKERSCIGVDIGGSDIKMAASVFGKLIWTKEYDWNPASSPTVEGIIEPIMGQIGEAQKRIELAGGKVDAVGISFPDIVIADRIVGGETPKTKAMRENPRIDYETEFAKLRDLKELILPLCTPDGSVHLTNDGNMAAFTAAVELAAGGEQEQIRGGVIAHSLGTDLGTGWLLSDGTIPEFPLEMYDLLLDMGDFPSAALPPEDMRSTRNENSGMNGVRRYMGQAAAYRLGWKRDPLMLEGFVETKDDRLHVPTSPVDLRKPCLEHLMQLASEGKPAAENIFREIGENLSVVTSEMKWLFGKTPATRILFGRFVKSRRCFELLCEGFAKGKTGIKLITADEDLANTTLMKQLSEMDGVTVAQFAQAIGAIYFALT